MTGAVIAVQRTSSDLRLNPHLHVVALDGAWFEKDGDLTWEGLRLLLLARETRNGEVQGAMEGPEGLAASDAAGQLANRSCFTALPTGA